MSFPVPGTIVRMKIIPLAAALAILLSGCVLEPARSAGRTASPCGMGALLYCEVGLQLDIESCHCARRSDLRYSLRNLGRH